MKGIVIRYFAVFIIALIGFYLGFRMFQRFLGKSEDFGCRLSGGCGDVPEFKTVQIKGGYLGDIVSGIMKYAYACWLESGEGSAQRDIWCYEVYIQNIYGYYNKTDFMNLLGNREDIPHNFLDYEVPEFNGESLSVYILYNSTSRKVVVK